MIAGGRRLAALQALHVDGVLGEDHPVPCLMAGNAAMSGELSLAENVVRIAMHPADQAVAFSKLADAGVEPARQQSVSADLSSLSGMLAAYLDLPELGVPRLVPSRQGGL